MFKTMETPDSVWDGFDNAYGKDDAINCVNCGRPMSREGALFIHVVDGGGTVTAPSDNSGDPSADLGCWPVGPECAKKFAGLAEPIDNERN
jgi:hypothetical protein